MAKSSDSKIVKALAEILDTHNLTEIEIEREDGIIRVARETQTMIAPMTGGVAPMQPSMPSAPALTETTTSQSDTPTATVSADSAGAVTSPMVGTAYLAPEPGSAPFIKQGDSVTMGQTLFIVEAMKTMNPITAPVAGTVTQILVSDAQAIEFGEVLAVIE